MHRKPLLVILSLIFALAALPAQEPEEKDQERSDRRGGRDRQKKEKIQPYDLMRDFISDVGQGRHAQAGWPSSAYRVSKVGLNALTRILSAELAGSELRINAVCPGWVRTRMGGTFATRSPAKGADSIVWAATLPAGGPAGVFTGKFIRDRKVIEW